MHKYNIVNYLEYIIKHNFNSYFLKQIVHIIIHYLHYFIYSHKIHRLIKSIILISIMLIQI